MFPFIKLGRLALMAGDIGLERRLVELLFCRLRDVRRELAWAPLDRVDLAFGVSVVPSSVGDLEDGLELLLGAGEKLDAVTFEVEGVGVAVTPEIFAEMPITAGELSAGEEREIPWSIFVRLESTGLLIGVTRNICQTMPMGLGTKRGTSVRGPTASGLIAFSWSFAGVLGSTRASAIADGSEVILTVTSFMLVSSCSPFGRASETAGGLSVKDLLGKLPVSVSSSSLLTDSRYRGLESLLNSRTIGDTGGFNRLLRV